MKTRLAILCAAFALVRVYCVEAAISGYFESSGNHAFGSMDYVSVSFTIYGIDHPRDLLLGQSYQARYSAVYTTTSDDPEFTTTDTFSGMGTVVQATINDTDDFQIEIQFPQNPLPGAWPPPESRIHFAQYPSEPLKAGWSASPYGFLNLGVLEYQAFEPQGCEIASFSRNGNITWTSPIGSVCTVEWAPRLTMSYWKHTWMDLDEFRSSNEFSTVDVPMFYRVVCHTNGYLQPMRVGTELTYAVSNSYGQTWILTETTAGMLYMPDRSLVPDCASKYYMVIRAETWDDYEPEGIGFLWNDAPYSYVRSTTNSVFELQGSAERRALHEAEAGVVWTNQFGHFKNLGEITIECSIVGSEVITVPAGTFECTRCELTVVGISEMTCTDWIRHDLGLVKRVSVIPNLIGGSSPVTYQLETITR